MGRALTVRGRRSTAGRALGHTGRLTSGRRSDVAHAIPRMVGGVRSDCGGQQEPADEAHARCKQARQSSKHVGPPPLWLTLAVIAPGGVKAETLTCRVDRDLVKRRTSCGTPLGDRNADRSVVRETGQAEAWEINE